MGTVYQFTASGLQPIQDEHITIGQRVVQAHKGLTGVVCEPPTQHSLGYTVIYPDGSESQSQRLDCRSPFTRITLVNGVVSADEVAALIRLRDAKRITDRQDRDNAAVQKVQDVDRIVEELKALYPWAKANKPSANLKKELNTAFPGIKFSVRSDHNSIRINWTDGPTASDVEAVGNKYENGHFNGMEDIHEYDHSAYGEAADRVLGRVTYVFTSRHLSARFLKDITLEVCMEYGHDTLPIVKGDESSAYVERTSTPYCNGANDSLDEKIHRVAHERAA